MRIGYIVKRYPRYSETFIVNEILAHEAAGTEIEIFALRPPNDTRFQEAISRVRAPVTYVPSGASKGATFWAGLERAAAELPGFWPKLETASGQDFRDVYQAAQLACEARHRGIDHLHAHFATVSASVGRLAAHFADLPYSLTAHAKDIFHETVESEDLERKLADAAAVITVSDFNLRFLSEAYPAAASKVERLYNGLPLDAFPFRSPRERPPLIIAVGRLVEKKGFADLIEACGLLTRRGVAYRCRIIGEGLVEAELRDRIRKLELESSVTMQGPCPLAEVAAQVHSAAVLAAPCVVGEDGNRDGLPTVLLEAMALGTPCVSTDVTGIPEVLEDGSTGLAVPQHDPAALSVAIERLLTDPELRMQLATRARARIEKDFDIVSNAARQREIFERSVRGHRASVSRAR